MPHSAAYAAGERVPTPELAGRVFLLASAVLTDGTAFDANEHVTLIARFDAEGFLWLDVTVANETLSYPVGGRDSRVRRLDPIAWI